MQQSDTYKGFTWKNKSELSQLMGYAHSYVGVWLKNHEGKSIYDCIDYVLDIQKRRNSTETYREYTWKNMKDLSLQMGYNEHYVFNWLYAHPGKSIHDCIDYVMDHDK